MSDLGQYLSAVSCRRFEYGSLDCCIFIADWLVERGFDDPMLDRRGTYHNESEYQVAMKIEGGVVRSCHRRLSAIGLQPTKAPVEGDVCLVKTAINVSGRIRLGATAGICASDSIRAVVTAQGIFGAPFPLLYAWSASSA